MTTVRVKEDTKAFVTSGWTSHYAGKVGEATNEKPQPGYEVLVRFNDPECAFGSFMWSELELVIVPDDQDPERRLVQP